MTDAGTFANAVAAAIHEQQLAEFLRNTGDTPNTPHDEAARRIASQAQQSLDTIAAECGAAAEAFCAMLEARGINASFDAAALRDQAPQYHHVTITLQAHDPSEAFAAARDAGWDVPLPLDGAGWAAFRRCNGQARLIRYDGIGMRIYVRWPNQFSERRFVWRFRPSIASASRISAPAFLWPAMICAHPILSALGSRTPSIGEWLGTPQDLLVRLFEFADIRADDVLLDVGCGDGRVLIEAARTIGCHAFGIENDPELHTRACEAAATAGLAERIEVRQADARTAPFPDASVVFLFLPADMLGPVLDRLRNTLPQGVRIVAHEQTRLVNIPPPDASAPLFGERSMTVAHLWRV